MFSARFLNTPHTFEMLINTHSPTVVLAPTLSGLMVQYAEVVHTAQDFKSGPTYTHALTDPSGAAPTSRRTHSAQPLLPTSLSHGQDPKALNRF